MNEIMSKYDVVPLKSLIIKTTEMHKIASRRHIRKVCFYWFFVRYLEFFKVYSSCLFLILKIDFNLLQFYWCVKGLAEIPFVWSAYLRIYFNIFFGFIDVLKRWRKYILNEALHMENVFLSTILQPYKTPTITFNTYYIFILLITIEINFTCFSIPRFQLL